MSFMLWPCFALNVVQHEHKLLDTKYKRKKIVELICMNYNAEKNKIINSVVLLDQWKNMKLSISIVICFFLKMKMMYCIDYFNEIKTWIIFVS